MNRQQRRAAARNHRGGKPFRDPLPAVAVRQSCDRCGAPVDWLRNEDVPQLFEPGDLDLFLAFLPVDLRPVALVRGDFWHCRRSACGELGVVLPAGTI